MYYIIKLLNTKYTILQHRKHVSDLILIIILLELLTLLEVTASLKSENVTIRYLHTNSYYITV